MVKKVGPILRNSASGHGGEFTQPRTHLFIWPSLCYLYHSLDVDDDDVVGMEDAARVLLEELFVVANARHGPVWRAQPIHSHFFGPLVDCLNPLAAEGAVASVAVPPRLDVGGVRAHEEPGKIQRDPGGLAQGFVDLYLGCSTILIGQ